MVDALTLWCLSRSDIWTQFVNQYTNRALQLDSLETSHPIEVPVQRSSQVFCVCRQAGRQADRQTVLGGRQFRRGIKIEMHRGFHSPAYVIHARNRVQALWLACPAESLLISRVATMRSTGGLPEATGAYESLREPTGAYQVSVATGIPI